MQWRVYRRIPLGLLAALIALATMVGVQLRGAQQVAEAVLVGQAVDSASNAGVAGAVISMSAAEQSGGKTPRRTVLADADGNFVFRSIAPGRYTLAATAHGYLAAASYGARRAGAPGRAVDVRNGESVTDVRIKLWRPAAIEGRVTTQLGDPLEGAALGILRLEEVGFNQSRFVAAREAFTDDRGAYRASGLSPGRYIVAVITRQTTIPVSGREIFESAISYPPGLQQRLADLYRGSEAPDPAGAAFVVGRHLLMSRSISHAAVGAIDQGRVFVAPPTFYSHARTPAEAQIIDLASGDERNGVDFALEYMAAVPVTGILVGPDGPMGNLGVRLVPTGSQLIATQDGFEVGETISESDGMFTFLGVPAGDYVIRASWTQPAASRNVSQNKPSAGSPVSHEPVKTLTLPVSDTLSGITSVSVADKPVSGLTVTLRRGARVTGQIEFQGSKTVSELTPPARTRLVFRRVDSRPPGFRPDPVLEVGPDATFATSAITPGRYIIEVPSVDGWHLHSAVSGGRDISDSPIDILFDDLDAILVVLTRQPTVISGIVIGSDNKPDVDAEVFIFSAERDHWREPRLRRFVRATTTNDGSYQVIGVPPGAYYVAALEAEHAIEWPAGQRLERVVQSSTRVELSAGERVQHNIRTLVIK